MMLAYLDGAAITLAIVVALLFLRAYRYTSDRLFLYFAIGFFVLSAQFIMTSILGGASADPATFGLRIVAFGTILAGVYDRNRR